jgi:ABC-type multidrug transport system fused ATPase/permease subunit
MGLKELFSGVWKESPSRFLVMLACVIVAGSLEGVGFTLFVPLFDQFSSGGGPAAGDRDPSFLSAVSRPENLIYLVGLILLVFGLKNLFLYWQRCFTEKIALDFDARLKRSMIENAFRAEWKYFLSEKYGTFVNAVNTHAEHSANAFRLLVQISGELLNVMIYCAVGLFISWKAFLFSAAVGALSFLLLRSTIRKSRQIGVTAVNIQRNFHNRTMEDLSGVKFIKANRLEEARIGGIRGLIDELNRTHFKSLKYQALVEVLPDFMMACVICCILYVSYVFLHQPAQQVLVLLAVLYRMNRRFVILQISRQRLAIDLPSYDICAGLIQKSGSAREDRGGNAYHGLAKEIRFDAVNFAYRDEPTLKNVSIVVPKNRVTAVIGKSGAGKTTFLDLFLGLLKPTSGSITIDGVPMDRLDLFAFRSRISYVPQEPFMIDGSIEANIRLGCPDATDDQVLAAARQAHADEFIQKQPEKYRTVVGDRGVRLSGGQRQRIALARALVRDPEILILDEATSALDNESERMVQKAIHELKGSRTLLMVAHRLSTIENADSIYVLDDGRVAASGTRDELLRSSDIFQTLYSGEHRAAEHGGAV